MNNLRSIVLVYGLSYLLLGIVVGVYFSSFIKNEAVLWVLLILGIVFGLIGSSKANSFIRELEGKKIKKRK